MKSLWNWIISLFKKKQTVTVDIEVYEDPFEVYMRNQMNDKLLAKQKEKERFKGEEPCKAPGSLECKEVEDAITLLHEKAAQPLVASGVIKTTQTTKAEEMRKKMDAMGKATSTPPKPPVRKVADDDTVARRSQSTYTTSSDNNDTAMFATAAAAYMLYSSDDNSSQSSYSSSCSSSSYDSSSSSSYDSGSSYDSSSSSSFCD